MDLFRWPQWCWSISKNLRTTALLSTGCSLEDQPGAMNDRDRWGWESEKSLLVALLDDDNDDAHIAFKKF